MIIKLQKTVPVRQNALWARFCRLQRSFAISFGREKLEGFLIFSRCAFLQVCYLKNIQNDPKDCIWGHPEALLGSSWVILKGFAPLLGPTGAPCGPPWAPQNQEKVAQRVSLEFHGFPGVF